MRRSSWVYSTKWRSPDAFGRSQPPDRSNRAAAGLPLVPQDGGAAVHCVLSGDRGGAAGIPLVGILGQQLLFQFDPDGSQSVGQLVRARGGERARDREHRDRVQRAVPVKALLEILMYIYLGRFPNVSGGKMKEKTQMFLRAVCL